MTEHAPKFGRPANIPIVQWLIEMRIEEYALKGSNRFDAPIVQWLIERECLKEHGLECCCLGEIPCLQGLIKGVGICRTCNRVIARNSYSSRTSLD